MAYVPVPKDLSKIKTKLAFNLTKRQLVCFSGATEQSSSYSAYLEDEAPACLFFRCDSGGPPGLSVFPWQYREQRRHVPDDRPHAPVLLSGYV